MVIPLEKSRIDDDDDESETTIVGIDRGMALAVDGLSLLSGAAHGATVSCCEDTPSTGTVSYGSGLSSGVSGIHVLLASNGLLRRFKSRV